MAENDTLRPDTLHGDGATRDEVAAKLEALARPRSVANPRRTQR